MPDTEGDYGFDVSVPNQDEKELFRKWIEAGAPFPEKEKRPFISEQELLVAIRDDLRKVSEFDRRALRYFTLAHLYNNNHSEKTEDAYLELYRGALSKAINSLSWESDIHVPVAIDLQKTIFRVNLRNLGWDRNDTWRAILKLYPYGLRYDTDRDKSRRDVYSEIVQLSGSGLPYIRADWFVSTATRPPLYHTILQIPETAQSLEKSLGVDVNRNFLTDRVVRSGRSKSGISSQNRLIERHPAANSVRHGL